MKIKKIIRNSKILTLILISMIAFSAVGCSSSSVESSSANFEQMTETEKVDYLISKACSDVEGLEDEELTDLGSQYIDDISKVVESETQFDNNETMEDIIYKGAFLEYYGKIKMDKFEKAAQEDSDGYKIAKTVNTLGTDAVQMVKYVYRGAEKADDDSTISNIKQVKESLKQLQ